MLRPVQSVIGVLGVGLIALLPTTACAVGVDKYVPNDSEIIVYVNVRPFLDSALIKKHALQPIRAAFDKYTDSEWLRIGRKLGWDPLKEVTSLTLSMTWPDGMKSSQPLDAQIAQAFANRVTIVRGNLNVVAIQAGLALKAASNPNSLKVHQQGSTTYYEFPQNEKDRSTFLCFLEKDVMLLSSSRNRVLEAVDKKSGKKKTVVNKDLQSLLVRVNPKDSLWLVSLAPLELKSKVADHPPTQDIGDKIQSVAASFLITDGLRAEGRILLSDAKAAAQFRKEWTGRTGQFVKLLSEKAPGPFQWAKPVQEFKKYLTWLDDLSDANALVEILTSATYASERGVVVGDAKVTAAQADKFLKSLKKP